MATHQEAMRGKRLLRLVTRIAERLAHWGVRIAA
jgi:hypothetical protein